MTKDVEERFLHGEESFAQTFGHDVDIGRLVRKHGAESVIG